MSGFFVVKWLLPEDLGLFNSFTIITGYIVLAHIGVPIGLTRELPYLLSKISEVRNMFKDASEKVYKL